jgi:hypothetical protein
MAFLKKIHLHGGSVLFFLFYFDPYFFINNFILSDLTLNSKFIVAL